MSWITTTHPGSWAPRWGGPDLSPGTALESEDGSIRVNRISIADVRCSLKQGYADFLASRTDIILLCIVYPVAGFIATRFAIEMSLAPYLFPMISGFALLGPVLAAGFCRMSRIREETGAASWGDAFSVYKGPSALSLAVLGLWLLIVFALWMMAAFLIYSATLGPAEPASITAFVRDVLTTTQGWKLAAIGIATGGVFASFVLAISVVALPLLLDRNPPRFEAAVSASVRAVRRNIIPVAAWGAIVASLLLVGSLILLVGLIVVVPVLGHSTWHLYRKMVTRRDVPAEAVTGT